MTSDRLVTISCQKGVLLIVTPGMLYCQYQEKMKQFCKCFKNNCKGLHKYVYRKRQNEQCTFDRPR